jgi:ribonuclease D
VVTTFLREHHARSWQIALTADALTDAMQSEAAAAKPLD